MRIDLLDCQTKILLKALNEREVRLRKINEDESDEDAAADAGNDILALLQLRGYLVEHALEAFGSQILNLDERHF
jgi:hypothetical protein